MLLYVSHGEHNNDWHRHLAASVLLCPDQPFELETRQDRLSAELFVLAPNTENRIEVSGRLIALMVDPDYSAYAPLARHLGEQTSWSSSKRDIVKPLRAHCQPLFAGTLHDTEVQTLIFDMIEIITGVRPETQGQVVDERISGVLHQIRNAMPEEIPVETLAKNAGLSKSRLLHLFKEQLGLPMGHYLLWRRLYESVRLWDEGMNMTDAAHAAGFYDQSHYTRTMRRMLDVTPSQIANDPTLVIHHCWRSAESQAS